MTTFTEEDGIVYVTIDDSRENDTPGKYLSGPKVKDLLMNGGHDVLQKYFPEHIYNALIRRYEAYKLKTSPIISRDLSKEERLRLLREKLNKRTDRN